MSEAMFSDPSISWIGFEAFEILTLRALAPVGVFTRSAKAEFLHHAGKTESLIQLANAMFEEDDSRFLAKLSDRLHVHPITICLEHAYAHGIRPTNSRVNSV